jgi:hypothetical protein
MKRKKQNDCVDLKNSIQKKLYAKYKNLTDEERATVIYQKLSASDSPIADFWRRNALQVAEKTTQYKSKSK